MKYLFYRITGFIILIPAVAGLILSNNLFLKFFSTAALIILAFSTIYHIVLLIRVAKRPPELTFVGNGNIYPMVRSTIELEGNNLPFQIPGIFMRIKFDLYEQGEKIGEKMSSLERIGSGKLNFQVQFERHGSFTLKNFTFIAGDIFGFTAARIKVKYEHQVRVLPYFIEEVKIPFFFDRGGEEVIQTVAKEDSTDFFENRKYYPGDDPRRINWKLFAHSEELHIREVEQIPPKTGQISLVFAPYSEKAAEYEYISALFYTTVYYLLKYNLKLKILRAGSDRILTLDKSNEQELQTLMDNSYHPFSGHKLLNELKGPIYFTSFAEYDSLLEKGVIGDKSFCTVSYDNSEVKVRDIVGSLFFIDSSDNLIRELLSKKGELDSYRGKESRLAELKELSTAKNIELKVYYTDEN